MLASDSGFETGSEHNRSESMKLQIAVSAQNQSARDRIGSALNLPLAAMVSSGQQRVIPICRAAS
jgi:hypothetical protein